MPETSNWIDGRLPDAKTRLFLVPSVINFQIKSVMLVNNHETEIVTAELWITRKGSTYSRRIFRKFPIAPSGDAQEHNVFIPLRSGDSIEGKASLGDQVDYVIAYCAEM
jgi:hypothetical protein